MEGLGTVAGCYVRRLWLLAAALVAIAVMGCAGGNIFGANPAEGGCGFRPDGLVAGDVIGTWRSTESGATVTLRADGTFELTAPAPATSRSTSARPPSPGRSPTPARKTGRWEVLPKTDSGDIELTFERADSTAHSKYFVTGTRAEPWLYTYGDGDPDSCHIVRYDRVK